MLFVSDYDVIPEPLRTYIIVMQLLVAIVSFLIGLIVLFVLKRKDPNMKKSFFFGIPLFFILVAIARGIFVYHDFYAPDSMDIPLWVMANMIVLVGFILLNYTIETHVYNKTKHIFTILGIALTGIYLVAVIFITKFIASIILYVANASQMLAPCAIYLIVSRKSTGVLRTKGIIILTGLFILIASQLSGIFSLFGVLDRIATSVFGPIAALIGFTVLGYGFIYSSEE